MPVQCRMCQQTPTKETRWNCADCCVSYDICKHCLDKLDATPVVQALDRMLNDYAATTKEFLNEAQSREALLARSSGNALEHDPKSHSFVQPLSGALWPDLLSPSARSAVSKDGLLVGVVDKLIEQQNKEAASPLLQTTFDLLSHSPLSTFSLRVDFSQKAELDLWATFRSVFAINRSVQHLSLDLQNVPSSSVNELLLLLRDRSLFSPNLLSLKVWVSLQKTSTSAATDTFLLAEVVQMNSHLQLLWIDGLTRTAQDLSPDHYSHLLVPGSALTNIRLRHCELSNDDMLYLSDRVAEMPHIQSLDFCFNQLEDEGASHLLMVLHGMYVESVQQSSKKVGEVYSLSKLYLHANKIQNIPLDFQLQGWQYLKELGVRAEDKSSKLSSPPLTREQMWTSEPILKYFKDLSTDPVHPSHVRLCLVGSGGAGKSTLTEALTMDPSKMNEFLSTIKQRRLDGVQSWSVEKVEQWAIERDLPSSLLHLIVDNQIDGRRLHHYYKGNEADLDHLLVTKEEIKLKIRFLQEIKVLFEQTGYISTAGAAQTTWKNIEVIDFAGQLEYYASHQLFINGYNSIFLVLAPAASSSVRHQAMSSTTSTAPSKSKTRALDATSHRRTSQWNTWLRFVHSLCRPGQRTQVHLVATHLDQFAIPEEVLLKEAKSLANFYNHGGRAQGEATGAVGASGIPLPGKLIRSDSSNQHLGNGGGTTGSNQPQGGSNAAMVKAAAASTAAASLNVEPYCYRIDYRPSNANNSPDDEDDDAESSLDELRQTIMSEANQLIEATLVPGSYLKVEERIRQEISRYEIDESKKKKKKRGKRAADEPMSPTPAEASAASMAANGGIDLTPIEGPPLTTRAALDSIIAGLNDKLKIDPALRARALTYLQSIGLILLSSDDKLVVLEPVRWLSRVLSLFIRDEGAEGIPFDEQGWCTQEDIDEAFFARGFALNEDHSLQITGLMVNLDLCFHMSPTPDSRRITGRSKFMFPSKLPVKKNATLARFNLTSAEKLNEASVSKGDCYMGRRLEATKGQASYLPPSYFYSLQVCLAGNKDMVAGGGSEQSAHFDVEVKKCELYRNHILMTLKVANDPNDSKKGAIEAQALLRFQATECSLDIIVRVKSGGEGNTDKHFAPLAEVARGILHSLFGTAISLLHPSYSAVAISWFALCPACLSAARLGPCAFQIQCYKRRNAQNGVNSTDIEQSTIQLFHPNEVDWKLLDAADVTQCFLDERYALSPDILLLGARVPTTAASGGAESLAKKDILKKLDGIKEEKHDPMPSVATSLAKLAITRMQSSVQEHKEAQMSQTDKLKESLMQRPTSLLGNRMASLVRSNQMIIQAPSSNLSRKGGSVYILSSQASDKERNQLVEPISAFLATEHVRSFQGMDTELIKECLYFASVVLIILSPALFSSITMKECIRQIKTLQLRFQLANAAINKASGASSSQGASSSSMHLEMASAVDSKPVLKSSLTLSRQYVYGDHPLTLLVLYSDPELSVEDANNWGIDVTGSVKIDVDADIAPLKESMEKDEKEEDDGLSYSDEQVKSSCIQILSKLKSIPPAGSPPSTVVPVDPAYLAKVSKRCTAFLQRRAKAGDIGQKLDTLLGGQQKLSADVALMREEQKKLFASFSSEFLVLKKQGEQAYQTQVQLFHGQQKQLELLLANKVLSESVYKQQIVALTLQKNIAFSQSTRTPGAYCFLPRNLKGWDILDPTQRLKNHFYLKLFCESDPNPAMWHFADDHREPDSGYEISVLKDFIQKYRTLIEVGLSVLQMVASAAPMIGDAAGGVFKGLKGVIDNAKQISDVVGTIYQAIDITNTAKDVDNAEATNGTGTTHQASESSGAMGTPAQRAFSNFVASLDASALRYGGLQPVLLQVTESEGLQRTAGEVLWVCKNCSSKTCYNPVVDQIVPDLKMIREANQAKGSAAGERKPSEIKDGSASARPSSAVAGRPSSASASSKHVKTGETGASKATGKDTKVGRAKGPEESACCTVQ